MDHKFYFTADKVRHRIELIENNLFQVRFYHLAQLELS